MHIRQKDVRKVLENKITQLNDIIADIDHLLTKMETDYYRVSIFGSARMKQESVWYKEVYDLAFQLAMRGVDIVTGGGPGLMDAANKGAKDGGRKSRSIGLPIELPFETDANMHLDVKRHHKRFSSRLDEFMRISHAVVVTPGGIGTLLEMFYTWQLIQVGHIAPRPILLLGGKEMWKELLDWCKKWPLKMELMSPEDMDNLVYCKDVESVLTQLRPHISIFRERSSKKQNPGMLAET
ncbi:MAG: LOG family protein [Deltaproteobacteria bacterium]|nr:LOG family protein [Deltaproteobacteria bacterium]